MSGHIFYKDGFYGHDDALYVAVRLLDILARGDATMAELRDRMPEVYNTPEVRFDCPEEEKFRVIEELKRRPARAGAEVDTTDGVRVRRPGGLVAAARVEHPARCWSRAPRRPPRPAWRPEGRGPPRARRGRLGRPGRLLSRRAAGAEAGTNTAQAMSHAATPATASSRCRRSSAGTRPVGHVRERVRRGRDRGRLRHRLKGSARWSGKAKARPERRAAEQHGSTGAALG
jgi:hypothetical protein